MNCTSRTRGHRLSAEAPPVDASRRRSFTRCHLSSQCNDCVRAKRHLIAWIALCAVWKWWGSFEVRAHFTPRGRWRPLYCYEFCFFPLLSSESFGADRHLEAHLMKVKIGKNAYLHWLGTRRRIAIIAIWIYRFSCAGPRIHLLCALDSECVIASATSHKLLQTHTHARIRFWRNYPSICASTQTQSGPETPVRGKWFCIIIVVGIGDGGGCAPFATKIHHYASHP